MSWRWLPIFWLVALAIYNPALHGGVLWDDIGHLTSPGLRGATGLWRIWFEIGATQQYYPVVHTAFWIFDRLWGANTFGYHIVNVTCHALSAWLIVILLRRLQISGSVLAATLFLVHPLQVESVAWITELKNTLSTVFFLAAALAYLRFDAERRRSSYIVALVLFGLAVFSKTVTASLPAALLVIFWWQRGRVTLADVKPLVPFFVVGIAGGLITASVEHSLIGASGAYYDRPLVERVLIAGRVVWFYLAKILVPVNLAFMYPRWNVDATVWWQWTYPVALVSAFAALWRWRHRSRSPLAAALLFVGLLFPALGFVNVYPFRFSLVADHFQYLAGIAIFAALAAGVTRILGRLEWTCWLAVVLLGAPLSFLSWRQSFDYTSNRRLFEVTLERNPDCWMCHHNLGDMELEAGNQDAAIAHLDAAVRLNGNDPLVRHDRAIALARVGRRAEALGEYDTAVRLDPVRVPARQDYGEELRRAGRLDEARMQFAEAVRLAPGSAVARLELGVVLVDLNRPADALPHLRESVRLDTSSVIAHVYLGRAFGMVGQWDPATAEFREVLRLDPQNTYAMAALDQLAK